MSSTLLVNDLTGFSLGEKKTLKEKIAGEFAEASKKLAELKLTLDVDMPAFEKQTRDTERRGVVATIFYMICTDYAEELTKFCSNADYKEAIQEAANKVVITSDKYSNQSGERAEFEIKDKTIFIKIDSSYLSYSTFPEELSKFLEKSL